MSVDSLDTLDDGCFIKFINLIHALTGITIAKNRKSMVQGRLRKRVLALSLKSYEEYFDFVVNNEAEKTPFIDSVTTNETYFFRTPRIWNYIETQLLPDHLQKHPGKTFSAWSAASSTGEEAHSLAVLCQQFKDRNNSFDYEISASDISQRVVTACRSGIYQGRSIETFKSSMPLAFSKYMVKNGPEAFSVQADIKKKINFFEHNLFAPIKDRKMYDLILIRNVFIYFTPADQKKVLDLILPRLNPGGILIIGESESITGINAGLAKVENLIYRKASG
ncbi:protein-glutamate O-methyltransferase CheR [Bdellovibrio bacteriovorus]|uniref:CheR family methyltransferase n=1 Tax=Bdellovibrio bacteriovorus TaxID=959 RepID=UPI0021CFD776|nr:protein-glutamate O-methyltransferase CheR [Bdellovibrio bacteriovorus]UXR63639.1 protein-glutamate O-methyltransferase CheR [Bdellovibrio bacteriovorus]